MFTSSAGVYSEDAQGEVVETSQVVPRGQARLDRLLDAEDAVRKAGGVRKEQKKGEKRGTNN